MMSAVQMLGPSRRVRVRVRRPPRAARVPSDFVVAYGAVVLSGFLMGVLCGWAMWG